MDWGSRFFWGIMVWVAVDLAWLRWAEAYLPIAVGCAVGLAGLVATMVILKRIFPMEAPARTLAAHRAEDAAAR